MILNSIRKTVSLLLIIGLNWSAISAIGWTRAYFNDTEVSKGNAMEAGKLDFYLEGKGFNAYDFNQTQTQEEKIKVINENDNLGFKYSVLAEITNENNSFCGNLNLSVDLNGISYYSGSLSGFYNISYISAPLPGSPDEWDFQITGQNPLVEGACYFDFVFQSWQEEMGNYGNGGFFDEEKIGNVISTNTDCGAADHLVINEVQIAGVTATDEFVELYNPTNSEINISGWKLQYKTATGGDWTNKTGVSGLPSVSKIEPYGFFLLAGNSYSGSVSPNYRHSANWGLGDSAGHVRIINDSESEIDKVGYGASADSAEGGSPAPNPIANQSVERGLNGYDSDDNSKDFIIKNNPTPTNSSGNGMPKIVINEFLASGVAYNDFVEIYNGSSSDFEAGWQIKIENSVGSSNSITISSKLAAGEWKVVYLDYPDILDEKGIIILYDNDDKEIDKISYYDAIAPDSSFARIPDGSPNWVDPVPTPGKTNVTVENLKLAGLDLNNFISEETMLSDVDAIESGGTSSNENGALEEELSSDGNGSAGIDVADIDTVDIDTISDIDTDDAVSDNDNNNSIDNIDNIDNIVADNGNDASMDNGANGNYINANDADINDAGDKDSSISADNADANGDDDISQTASLKDENGEEFISNDGNGGENGNGSDDSKNFWHW